MTTPLTSVEEVVTEKFKNEWDNFPYEYVEIVLTQDRTQAHARLMEIIEEYRINIEREMCDPLLDTSRCFSEDDAVETHRELLQDLQKTINELFNITKDHD